MRFFMCYHSTKIRADIGTCLLVHCWLLFSSRYMTMITFLLLI